MDRPYVEWLRVENFRCIRSVDVHLTPLHAFIGPNDSGKSSLLRAIRSHSGAYWVSQSGAMAGGNFFAGTYPSLVHGLDERRSAAVAAATTGVAMMRLDPDELRKPSNLIPAEQPLWFQNEKGLGLPALYDALVSRDIGAYSAINQRFVELFPTAKSLLLQNASSTHKAVGLTLVDGTKVGAAEMSEGMLYWLALAVVSQLTRQAILLVEEPENGLHPARVAEVMRVLRDLTSTTQVIIATHSPLVINELQPEEVTIVTRTPERGTICTPMTATKNFAQRSKTYALGELWLSYADGDLEKELVVDKTEAAKAG